MPSACLCASLDRHSRSGFPGMVPAGVLLPGALHVRLHSVFMCVSEFVCGHEWCGGALCLLSYLNEAVCGSNARLSYAHLTPNAAATSGISIRSHASQVLASLNLLKAYSSALPSKKGCHAQAVTRPGHIQQGRWPLSRQDARRPASTTGSQARPGSRQRLVAGLETRALL